LDARWRGTSANPSFNLLFSTTSIATLALLVAGTTAIPTTNAANVLDACSLELTNTKIVEGGVVTLYTDVSLPLVNVTAATLDSAPGSNLARRCGSNAIVCDSANFRARPDLCGCLSSRPDGCAL
jgi:hypothetical protein